MKRIFYILSVIFMAVLITGVSMDVHAETQSAADFTYRLGTDGEVVITGYRGSPGEMIVPAQIDGKPVRSIAKEAFYNNGNITKASLPEGLSKIEASAFQGAYNLVEIVLPNTLRIIEAGAFNSCGKLKSITIPQGITAIAENTFFRCLQLMEAYLPNGLKSIGSKAFAVTGLIKIDLPLGIENIGDHAFYGNRYLKEITLPNTVKRIDEYAFFVCDSLAKVILPTSLQSMSAGVFDKCPNLEIIAIPKTISNIRADALFSGSLRPNKLTILAPIGSAAENYARQSGIPFAAADVTAGVIMTLDDRDMSGQKTAIDLSSDIKTLSLEAETYPETLWPGIVWKSSNPAVADVDSYGQVMAYKKGEVLITAMAADGSGAESSFTLNVANLAKEIIISSPSETTSIFSKGKMTLKAAVLPATADNKSVEWSVSDPSVASISSKGILKAAEVSEKRTVTVTATAKDGSDITASYELEVYPLVDQARILKDGQVLENKAELTIDLASETNSIQLTTENLPADSLQKMTWKSSAKRVADVDAFGLITGLSEGKATITATTMDGTRNMVSINVNVSTIVKDVMISGNSSVASEQKLKLSAIVLPEDASDKKLIWESSDDTIARVNKNNGEVTARKVDTQQQVTITATARDGSGVQAKMDITVHPLVTDILLSRDGILLEKKEQLEVDLSDTNTLNLFTSLIPMDAIQAVKWVSSNERVATVDQSGIVTLLKKGNVRITATATDGSRSRANLELTITNKDQ